MDPNIPVGKGLNGESLDRRHVYIGVKLILREREAVPIMNAVDRSDYFNSRFFCPRIVASLMSSKVL